MLVRDCVVKSCKKCGLDFYCLKRRYERSQYCNKRCWARDSNEKQFIKRKLSISLETIEETRAIMIKVFEKFFEKTDACWEWLGSKKVKMPYGMFTFRNKKKIAHRVSYELYKEKIPHGKLVLHNCDNPSCVNPEHLKLGTHLDNINDKRARGRCKVEKLNEQQVREIKNLLREKVNGTEIGKRYNISRTQVSYIKLGKQWKWLT